MTINGKTMTLADVMVSVKQPDETDADYIWVAYDNTKERLPIATAPSALQLAKIVGHSYKSIYSYWSKYSRGLVNTTKYAKVYVGGDDDDE